MIENPFIPHTISWHFFDKVSTKTEASTQQAKSIFNQCGQTFGGQDLARYILRRDRWLYENISRPGKLLNLSDKIITRPEEDIDETLLKQQVQNTKDWLSRRSK